MTAAELAGDFSQSKVKPVVTASAANAANSPFAGMAGQTITNLAPYLDPAAVKIYKYFKFPIVQNSGDFGYVPATANLNQPTWTLRGDHTVGEKNTLSFSFFYQYDDNTPRYLNWSSMMLSRKAGMKSQHYTLQDVWTLSPQLVNSIVFGYHRTYQFTGMVREGFNFSDMGTGYPAPDPLAGFSYRAPGEQFGPSRFSLIDTGVSREVRWTSEARDTVSYTRGSHYFKMGAMYGRNIYIAKSVASPLYVASGTFLTNAAAEFLVGWPGSGNWTEPPYYPIAKPIVFTFFQDDWKITPRLALNLGVRWEPSYWGYKMNDRSLLFFPGAQSTRYPNFPSGLLTVGDSGYPGRSGAEDDLNNFAPRLGVAYRLDDQGKRVIRGAWGLFYNVVTSAIFDGYQGVAAFPFNHSYSTKFDHGYPGVGEWLDWFPYELGSNSPDLGSPADPTKAVFNPRTAYGAMRPGDRVGYIQQWNLTYEDEFRPGWMASVSYQGHHGHGLGLRMFWNLPEITGATDTWDAANMADRRPDQRYRYFDMNYWTPEVGDSNWSALNLKVTARRSNFRMMSWYTLARTRSHLDGTWWYHRRGNPNDISFDYGPPSHSRVHNLMLTPSWDLPVFRERKDIVGKLLGGWTATMVFNIQDGQPVDLQATTSNKSYQCSACFMRPNYSGGSMYLDNWLNSASLTYVNAAAFTQPDPGTYGTVHANPLKWPYTKNVDMSLMKSFRLGFYGEDTKFTLRADFFNFFNWTNWVAPGNGVVLATASTMNMTSYWTAAPRTMQVGGVISW